MAKRRKSSKKSKSRRSCKGINKRTGKLKKGYRYKKGSTCPIKVK